MTLGIGHRLRKPLRFLQLPLKSTIYCTSLTRDTRKDNCKYSSQSRHFCSNMPSNGTIKAANRLRNLGTNVWVQFVALNAQYNPVNVGQGFPDYSPPEYLKDALVTATKSTNPLMNQYTRSQGHGRLVNSISSLFSKLHGREINAMTEVVVTNGAYESLFCAISAYVNEGDEVIIFEPFFDCYIKMIEYVGAVPVGVPIRPCKENWKNSGGWKVDKEELSAVFTSKTKAIIFNTPNNPLGKVFQRDEIEMIADLCKKHNVLCISDEVYEWLVYPGSEHIRIATLPGMWERTLTISSAGKTFSVTGWKIGWTIGPEELLSPLQSVHANMLYTLCTPTQEAIAIGLEKEMKLLGTKDSYFHEMRTMLLEKRDFMVKVLLDHGFEPVVPEGGYFIMADFSKFGTTFPGDDKESLDMKFCKWMIKEKKIGTIPPSVFYHQHGEIAKTFVRFCFIKQDSTLKLLEDALKKW